MARDANEGIDMEPPKNALDAAGSFLFERPIINLTLNIAFGFVVPLAISLFGGSSKLYLIFNKGSTLTDPEKFFFDIGGGLSVSFFSVGLGVILNNYGAVNRALKAAKSTQGASREHLAQSTDRMRKHIEQMPQVIRSEIGAISPLLHNVASDPKAFYEVSAVAASVATAIGDHEQSSRVIVTGLARGLRERFEAVASGLESTGTFMDPGERRNLTESLLEVNNEYVVIINGIYDITEGPAAWHAGYLQLLDRVAKEDGRAALVYISDTKIGGFGRGEKLPAEVENSIQHVKSLGIKCHLVHDLASQGGAVTAADRRSFYGLGHLIEVFGSDFYSALSRGKALRVGQAVPWKATALRFRSGELLGPRDAQVLEVPKAIELCGSTTIWGSEVVAKLVRAGGQPLRPGYFLSVLSYIAQNATRV